MLLFDAHSHLPAAAPMLAGHPRVVCGTREADWEAVLAHANSEGQVIPMLGLHPWFAGEASPQWLDRLEALLRANPAGVGECGLDFTRKEVDPDRPAQEACFRAQLRLAHALCRPVAVHVVRAWGRIIDILREEGVPPAGALVHAFSGSPETALELQRLGVCLSFSGALLDPGRTRLREALAAVDPARLLLETDGATELEPVVRAAAAILGVPVDDLAAQTWENGHRCFKELMA
jgi:TatD DNase family protein